MVPSLNIISLHFKLDRLPVSRTPRKRARDFEGKCPHCPKICRRPVEYARHKQSHENSPSHPPSFPVQLSAPNSNMDSRGLPSSLPTMISPLTATDHHRSSPAPPDSLHAHSPRLPIPYRTTHVHPAQISLTSIMFQLVTITQVITALRKTKEISGPKKPMKRLNILFNIRILA